MRLSIPFVVAGALATASVAVAYWDTDGEPEVAPKTAQAGLSNACDGGTKIEGVDGDVVSGDYPITFDGYSDTVRITVIQTASGPTFAFKVLNYPNDHAMTSVLGRSGDHCPNARVIVVSLACHLGRTPDAKARTSPPP